MNSTYDKQLTRLKQSAAGKIIRRLAGEERGLVLMEYCILALLIATVAIVAVALFGNTISGMFVANARAVTGDTEGAQKTIEKVRKSVDEGEQTVEEQNNKFNSGNYIKYEATEGK